MMHLLPSQLPPSLMQSELQRVLGANLFGRGGGIDLLAVFEDRNKQLARVKILERFGFPGLRRVKNGVRRRGVHRFVMQAHFIRQSLAGGAVVVLCQKQPEVDIPYILVADSRLALSRICCKFFDNPSRELTMIGVTGTNGKTTVTTLIKHMLEQCLHTKVGLIGTNANVIGDEVLHTEHTTPDAYELQKLLRRMEENIGCVKRDAQIRTAREEILEIGRASCRERV